MSPVVKILAMLTSFISMCFALIYFNSEQQFLGRAIHTTGTVVSVNQTTIIGYKAVVRFRLDDQTVIESKSKGVYFPESTVPNVGQSVNIYHDADEVQIDNFREKWSTVVLYSVFGIVFLLLAIYTKPSEHRASKPEEKAAAQEAQVSEPTS